MRYFLPFLLLACSPIGTRNIDGVCADELDCTEDEVPNPAGTTSATTTSQTTGTTTVTEIPTGYIEYEYEISAVVQIDQAWTGVRRRVVRQKVTGLLLCDYEIEMTGSPDLGVQCTDADSNPCLFQFDVQSGTGAQIDGVLSCSAFGASSGFETLFGYIDDYRENGVAHGPKLMVWNGIEWVPYMLVTTTWSPAAGGGGTFTYAFPMEEGSTNLDPTTTSSY